MKKYLLAYPFLGKVLSLSLTTLIAHLITLAYYPLLTKTYSPEDFGNFQTFQSVSAYFIVICSFRYDQAIISSTDKAERLRLFFSSLVIALMFCLVIAIGLFFARGVISRFENYRIIGQYWYLIPLTTLIGGIVNSCLSIAIMEQKFQRIGSSKILQSSVTVFGQVLANASFRNIGLVLGDLMGKTVSILAFVKYTFRRLVTDSAMLGWRACAATCRKYKEFAWLSTPGALLNLAGLNLPLLLIAGFYSQSIYGYIALVDRLFGLPSALIGQSVSQVFTAEFNAAISRDREEARILYLRQIKYLALLISPVLLFLPFAPAAFGALFGSEWATSGTFFILMAPLNIAGFIIIPVIPTLTILNKQKALFAWVLVRVIITIGSVLVLSNAKAKIELVLLAHSVIMAAMYALYAFIAYNQIKRYRTDAAS